MQRVIQLLGVSNRGFVQISGPRAGLHHAFAVHMAFTLHAWWTHAHAECVADSLQLYHAGAYLPMVLARQGSATGTRGVGFILGNMLACGGERGTAPPTWPAAAI